MKQIIYVSHDQLNAKYGALKNADPKNDVIVLVQSDRMVTGEHWNKIRLYFLISSALHFAEELKDAGFTVIYQKAATTVDGLKIVQGKYKNCLLYTSPSPRDGLLSRMPSSA